VLHLVVAFSLAAVGPVAAQTPPAPRGSMALPVDPQLLNDLPELKGVVPWKVLGQVTTAQAGGRPVPEFSPEIRKLDQQDVRLQGYMLPIVAGETHDHFRPAGARFRSSRPKSASSTSRTSGCRATCSRSWPARRTITSC
jgi:hypothetical protein